MKLVLKTQKEDTIKINTLNAISHEYLKNSDFEFSIQMANEALAGSEKINYRKGIALAYYRKGNVNNSQGKIREALENFSSSLKIFQEIGDKSRMGDCYQLIGIIQENRSDGLIKLFTALKLYEEIDDKTRIAETLQLIGGTHSYNGDMKEAEKFYLASLKISEKIEDKALIAQTTNGLGQLYASEGNYTKALEQYYAALKIYKALGNEAPSWGIPWSYSEIAGIFKYQGEVAEKSGDNNSARKKYIEVLKMYFDVLHFHEAKKNKTFFAESYRNIGNTYVKLKNNEKAKESYVKSLEFAHELNDKDELRKTYAALSNYDRFQGDYKKAYEHYVKYILYRDSLTNDEITKKSVQVQMDYEFEKKEIANKALQDKKDAEVARARKVQSLTITSLVILVVAILFVSLIQLRSNRHKKKANLLLQQQKRKVESTLKELKSTQAQLIQSEKMASLGELTAGIAHEIQNPLNFVNNFSEVNTELIEELEIEADKGNLQEVKLIAKDIKENEVKINHHGKRADAIVKGMLQHSQSVGGVKEPTDINALADEYLRLAYHGLRAKDKSFNAILDTDFDPAIGKVPIMPQDIGRVLLNLYNNAFYAVSEKMNSAPHGYEPRITVSTRLVPATENSLIHQSANSLIISVKDNGNGIPQKILDKIFQPFFTTKPTGQGTGLGLSLSYDIVKAHGGELRVETSEGEGSRFIIQLTT